jgi:hypothetical protein
MFDSRALNEFWKEATDEEVPLEIRESYGKAKSDMTHHISQCYKLGHSTKPKE